jgi:hypothetical protein
MRSAAPECRSLASRWPTTDRQRGRRRPGREEGGRRTSLFRFEGVVAARWAAVPHAASGTSPTARRSWLRPGPRPLRTP